MDVRKSDCGGIDGAGDYRFRGGHLIVTPHQIGIWSRHPDAIFSAVTSRLSSSIELYVLASWRLPGQAHGGQPAEPTPTDPSA
jgi:hypothetical protein